MRFLGLVLIVVWSALLSPVSRGDEAEPAKHGVKLSEWIRRLDSPDVGVRNNAASVLIGFGEAASPATSALAGLLRDDRNADIRRHAACALAQIGPKAKEATITLKKSAEKDQDPSVRIWAARALSKVAPDFRKEAVAVLVKFVAKPNAGFDRINAIDGLGEIGADARRAEPEMQLAAVDQDPEVARAARRALQKLQSR